MVTSLNPNIDIPKLGLRNYITNSDGDSGIATWQAYADAAQATPVDGFGGSPSVTFAVTSINPIRGVGSFLFTKPAVNYQGQGISTDFTIDPADQAAILQVGFDYQASANFVTGTASDVQVWIYDKTNAVVIPVSPQTIQGNGANNFNFKGIFQTNPNSTSYRLIFHIATTNALAWTFTFDNVTCGPQTRLFGAAITDWQAYTPTWQFIGTTTTSGFWRRVGDSMEVEVRLVASSNASGQISVNIPTGYAIDTSKISFPNVGESLGIVHAGRANAPVTPVGVVVIKAVGSGPITEVQFMGPTTGTQWDQTFPGGAWVSADYLCAKFFVPIVGWSSTVQMSNDTDTRVVAAKTYRNGTNMSLTGAVTDIPFDTVVFDTHGKMASGVYTIPVAGFYRVTLTGIRTTDNAASFNLYINGTNDLGSQAVVYAAPNETYARTGSTTISARVGDTVSFRAQASCTLNGSILPSFSVERLSGPSAIAATESVSCRYANSTGAAVPTGTSNFIDFPTKQWDSHNSVIGAGGGFSTTYTNTWRFVCPISGIYRVSMFAQTAATGAFADGINLAAQVYKSGVRDLVLMNQNVTTSASNRYPTWFGTATLRCLAGDAISFDVYQNSGVTPALAAIAAYNYVCIDRVGNY